MPTITIYTDLSPNMPLAFAALEANRTALAERGIVLPTAPYWGFARIRAHKPLWNAVFASGGKLELPNHWSGWLRELEDAAALGKDILLYDSTISGSLHKNFLFFLQSREQLKNCKFRINVLYGRPVCLFEQINRMQKMATPGTPLKTNGQTFLQDLARLQPALQEELGRENVTVLGDTSPCPTATSLSPAHEAFLAGLGLTAPYDVRPAHFLRFRSFISCLLLLMCRVGENTWPPLDENELVEILLELEKQKQWDASPLTPPDVRMAMRDGEKELLLQVEEACRLPAGSLACPPELATDAPWKPYAGLADEYLLDFARALPDSLADALRRRFSADAPLLSSGPRKLSGLIRKKTLWAPVHSTTGEPVLSVLTMTCNHENYIEQCMESVLEQRTNFPVQHIIIDDCSTDKTPEIIREYAKKHPGIRPVLLGEKKGGLNVRGLFSRCRTEFASLCDGDDYFTDPKKLQKQVDFLCRFRECALCFHPVDVTYEDGSPTRTYPDPESLPGGKRMFYTIDVLLKANLIQTNSVVYRWRFRDGLPSWFDPTLCPADWYWHLLHAEKGLVGYLPEHMSVYRRHAASLYITAEQDMLRHRLIHGMQELRMYDVCDRHFKEKYHRHFSALAMGVFTNYLRLSLDTGDESFLQNATKRFPHFAKDFLDEIKKLNPGLRDTPEKREQEAS